MFKSMKRIIRWAGKYRGRLYLGSVFSFSATSLAAANIAFVIQFLSKRTFLPSLFFIYSINLRFPLYHNI